MSLLVGNNRYNSITELGQTPQALPKPVVKLWLTRMQTLQLCYIQCFQKRILGWSFNSHCSHRTTSFGSTIVMCNGALRIHHLQNLRLAQPFKSFHLPYCGSQCQPAIRLSQEPTSVPCCFTVMAKSYKETIVQSQPRPSTTGANKSEFSISDIWHRMPWHK